MLPDSRKRNSINNIIFGYINQIFSLVLNFIGRIIFIRILGEEYLGINGLFSDILTMLSMADMGFGIAMSYSFYKPIAENDVKQIVALINFYKKIYNIIAILTTIFGVLLIPALKYLVNIDIKIPHLTLYYLLFLANTTLSYLFVYKTAIINASQKNYLISRYQIVINIIKTIIQIIVLIAFKNYFMYLLIIIIATLVNNLLASHKAEKLYPEIRKKNYELDKDNKNVIKENMKSVFLYKLSGVLLTGTDNILISVIIGTVWVGIYSNYNLLLNGINSLIGTFFNAVTSSIGNVVVTEKSKKQYEVFRILNVISLSIAAITVSILSNLISDFIYLWLGEKFILSNDIKIAILCNFYMANILRPIWSYREATGLYMKTKYIMLIASFINFILSIIGGYKFGMAGIIFASAISRICTYFWYEPKLLFENFFKKDVTNYFLLILKNVVLTIGLCVAMDILGQNYHVDSWWKLLLKLMIVGIISVACVIGCYFRTKEMKIIFQIIKDILKK